MTLILNGTDNSATTPAVTGTDTDTGVYYPAANQVALATNGTLALIVDASQNIGVGTASPVMKVQIESTAGLGYKVKRTSNGVAGGIGAGAQTGGQGLAVFTTDYFSNTPIIFGVNQTDSSVNPFAGLTERMRVNGGAPILCLAGGNTSATGTGIAFPATQSASSDANTLDDYEEGTYTVTLTPGVSGSITLQTGYTSMSYTRVGRVVTITGNPRIQSVSSPTGGILLTLPFPVRNGTSTTSRAGSSISYYDNSNAPLYFFSIPCTAGEASTTLTINVSSFSPAAVVPAANDELYVSFTYFTD